MYNKLQAKLLSDATNKQLDEHQLTPVPDNYRLWFEYNTGNIQGLSEEIDALVEQQKRITQTICSKLYQKYLLTGDQRDLDEARIAMSRLLNVMVEQLKIWDSSTGKFCSVLDDCTHKLQNDPSVAEIKEIITQIVAEAEQVQSSNQSMHSALQGLTSEIHELREDVERLGSEAITDALTEIANRRGFDRELKRLKKEAQATGNSCCLLMVDVDHFKNINDNFGHLVGDKILKFIANTLLQNIRGNDKLARFGGEEFAIILPSTDEEGALKVAENLRAAVSARQLTTGTKSRPIGRITVSIGLAVYRPGETEDELISRADQCMYAAKHGGRNQVKSESMIQATG